MKCSCFVFKIFVYEQDLSCSLLGHQWELLILKSLPRIPQVSVTFHIQLEPVVLSLSIFQGEH